MTEALVCVPIASGTMALATAAADPDDEPPGVRSAWCGLRVLPGSKVANSVLTVLPRITAPAARNRATTVASRAGVRPACSTLPSSVGMSAVSMMSFTPTGMPCSGPVARPSERSRSRAQAWARACFSSRYCQAWTAGSVSRTRARQASTNCSELIAPSAMARAASVALSSSRRLRSIAQRPYRALGSHRATPGKT